MELDGIQMLFFDKYISNNRHNISNISIEELFTSNCGQASGIDAINEYNKLGRPQIIPTNLDTELYNVHTFSIKTNGSTGIVTIIGINIDALSKYPTEKIPNVDILRIACCNHMFYESFDKHMMGSNEKSITENIIKSMTTSIMDKLGDVTDIMIQNPPFLNIELYPYQKRSVNWMHDREKNIRNIYFNINDYVDIGSMSYDVYGKKMVPEEEKKKINFYGGALIDEVGLGKTIQMTTLSLLNPATDLRYLRGDNKLYSRATLILCPSQLCGQWKRELENKINSKLNIVMLLTKTHHDKYTYMDLLDADFVIVSYAFMDNVAFIRGWLDNYPRKNFHKTKWGESDSDSVKKILEKIRMDITNNPTILGNSVSIIPAITWHRFIVDEFHEIYTIDKYLSVRNYVPIFDSAYKWCVTGTPFDKDPECLFEMVKFVTKYPSVLNDSKLLTNNNIKKYVTNNMFRRNTKKSVTDEYKLPPLEEVVVWLKFTHTERMIYNAFLANPNNSKYDIFLRKLCCHPNISEETKSTLSTCKSLDEIEKVMVKHYSNLMDKAHDIYNKTIRRVEYLGAKIKVYERKRQRRIMRSMGYNAKLEKFDENIITILSQKNQFNEEDGEIDLNDDELGDINIDLEENDEDNNLPVFIIGDGNQKEVMRLIGLKWQNGKNTLDNMNTLLENTKTKLNEHKKDFEGKKTTFEFYNNVVNKIKKTVNKDHENGNKDDDEMCGICLGEIPESDVGVTKCGHMYCYDCISSLLEKQSSCKCPYCRKVVKRDEIFQISYERKKLDECQSKEVKDKQTLINKVGTKLANLIYYLKKNNEHTIIFSQWDNLLVQVGDILDTYGIKNCFCRGNVWQRDKSIRTFNNNDDIKVIMLSSESAASGTNLTKASQVILLDPVYGAYEFRKNTEWQAVGRAYRMGQTKTVKLIRFVIKDTIEEEIYNQNLEEDAKHKTNIKIFESSGDAMDLTSEQMEEINRSVSVSNATKKKPAVKSKKILSTAVAKKTFVKRVVESDSDSDLENLSDMEEDDDLY